MRKLLCLTLCALLWTGFVHAQGVTTGSLSGVVADPNGEPLPGATVIAVLTTTGTRYVAITDGAGRFKFANVKVGGPYDITASLDGFQEAKAEGVFVRLGEDSRVTFDMQLEAATGEIVVVGEANPLINPTRAGAASSVGTAAIEDMPSVDRSLADFARTNPLFVASSDNGEATTLTVAGRNNRYNNISIDGSVNNDLFGLAATGTPGGQTEAQPISIEAVQELQLVTSSFDVRQGGFSGGSINAITRSGTNSLSGAVYGYYRDDSMVGDGPDDFPELGTFEEKQYGFRLGGPIVKDTAFFFVNGESSRLDRPTGWSLDGGAGIQWRDGAGLADAAIIRDFTISEYGYDPGGPSQVTSNTDSDNIFVRFDVNLNDSNNLVVRHNWVDSSNLILRHSNSNYDLPSFAYNIKDKTNSTVAQLNSVFGGDMFNEARLTYQTIEDRRSGPGDPFPAVRVNHIGGTSGYFEFGTEAYSTANSLDQTILEITDDFTFFAGDHEIIIGTHNELFSFDNLFIQQAFGAYRFDTVEDYLAGNAYQFDYTYSADSSPSDKFDVQQLGVYAGDTWRLRPNFTVMGGLRLDVPLFPDKPNYNPLVDEIYGLRTDEVPDGNLLWSPRLGFNWDVNSDGKSQVRGGVGLFSGRTPYVWISNNYARNGIEQVTLRAFGDIPFNPDPFNQPSSIGGASTQEVNLVDPDFEFPQVWRTNLAYDQVLPWMGLVATAEVIYTKSVNEILYQNLNLRQTDTLFDGRPYYGGVVSHDFSGAFYLTNTDEGEAFNGILKIEKPYGDGWWGSVSYAYGHSKAVTEGTSSRAVSNWQYHEGYDVNNPGLSTSDFDVPHRFNLSLSYEFNRDSKWSTVMSAFYNHQIGRPVTYIYSYNYPSPNGDTYGSNDLFYMPASADDVIIDNGTFAQLAHFMESQGLGGFFGRTIPRNQGRDPWTSSLDLSFRQQIPVPGSSSLEITLDILNFMNLIDKNSGHNYYTSFGTVTPAELVGVDEATGKPIYHLESEVLEPSDNPTRQLDNLRSRWRAKLGVRWSF